MAQREQIGKTTERAKCRVVVWQSWRAAGVTIAPVGPLGRNERAAAVGQTEKQKEHTATSDAADHGERAALERVALAVDRHRNGKITAMGSLPTLPSIFESFKADAQAHQYRGTARAEGLIGFAGQRGRGLCVLAGRRKEFEDRRHHAADEATLESILSLPPYDGLVWLHVIANPIQTCLRINQDLRIKTRLLKM